MSNKTAVVAFADTVLQHFPPFRWDEHQEKNNFPAIKLKQELFDFIKSLGYNIIKIGQDMYLAEK